MFWPLPITTTTTTNFLAEQLLINCIQVFHDLPQDQKEHNTQNEPISEYTRCSEHTASSTMYVMFCFDLDCVSWQKYIHFQRFLILLVHNIFWEGWRGGRTFIQYFCEKHEFHKSQVLLWNYFCWKFFVWPYHLDI